MQVRHFTASGTGLDGGSVLPIEHARLGWWRPPGVHIEPDEDPVQAAARDAASQPRGPR